MRVAFLNPQGNFDPHNSYLASHPDFGGQLVYVREVARTLGEMGHHADILTRRIVDPHWPEFASDADAYPGYENVRILRVPCGPDHFLPKEELWPHLGEWAEGVARLYRGEDSWPALWTGHYADGGLAAALLAEASRTPFTFTGHSLGAWKLDFLLQESPDALVEADARYNFGARIEAERAAMARSAAIIANSAAERREQYDHPAYRGAVDVEDDGRFAVMPPGVNSDIFDPDARSPREEETRATIRAAHERDI
ncbi:MAG TPA: glycosyltransferase, partial [Rubrobacter sp.]|nr:glycosyltransferase [Rubrobacter sp.]